VDGPRGIEGADLARAGQYSNHRSGRRATINEDNFSIAPLRVLLDPITALTDTVRETAGHDVKTVILFGSIARGEANIGSDIDLAVIAPAGWEGRADREDAVRALLGNNCNVLVFTPEDFTRLADTGEPVVQEILTDGVALIGSIPRMKSGVT
jgi:predicted nucleotidyltransferase